MKSGFTLATVAASLILLAAPAAARSTHHRAARHHPFYAEPYLYPPQAYGYGEAQRLYNDTVLLRRCPTVPYPYAINQMGGNNCTGGQSGSPQQFGK